MSTTIRKATLSDMDRMLDIYAYATRFMAEHGNPNQWAGSNGVTREKTEALLNKDLLFVGEEDGEICFVFAYIQGEDPTYKVIDDGEWLNDEPYGTIHRIASDGRIRGVVGIVTEWALNQNPNLRIDTHHDNMVMQNALTKAGYSRCGIIYLANGDPRIAYQKVRQVNN